MFFVIIDTLYTNIYKSMQDMYNFDRNLKIQYILTMKTTQEITNLHTRSITGYFEVMERYGMKKHDPEPLISQEDDSLLFTNSTIVPLKSKLGPDHLLGGGYFLLQNCLRLQVLKTLIENESTPIKYVSCFKMLGSLVDRNSLDCAIDATLEFLHTIAELPKNELIVWVHKGTEANWKNIFFSRNINVENVHPYSWKYGMADVYGAGITIARRYPDGSSKSFGNLVAIYRRNDLIGYEFGFGIESLIGRAMFCDSAFSGSIQLSVTGLEPNQLNYKIANLIGVVSGMVVAGVNRKQYRSRWFLLAQATRLLINLSIIQGLQAESLIAWIKDFTKLFFGNNISLEFIQYIKFRWSEISTKEIRFKNWAESQQGLFRQRGLGVLRFQKLELALKHVHDTYSVPLIEAYNKLIMYEPWSLEGGQD
jgi:hypothetical protein